MRRYELIICTVATAMMLGACGTVESNTNIESELTQTESVLEETEIVSETNLETETETEETTNRAVGDVSASYKFAVTNKTGKAIKKIYVRNNGSKSWGDNLLKGEAAVSKNEIIDVYVSCFKGNDAKAKYDIKIVLKDGTKCYYRKLKLSNMKDLEVYHKKVDYLKYYSISKQKIVSTKKSVLKQQEQESIKAEESSKQAESESASEAAAKQTTMQPTTVAQTTTQYVETTTAAADNGKSVINKTWVEDCDGSGNGYWFIEYSDGTTDIQY